MLHINRTSQSIQLYNLLKSIYTAPNDYMCIYSSGTFTGWVCKSGYTKPDFGSSEVDRLLMLGKQLEKARRKQIAIQNIG